MVYCLSIHFRADIQNHFNVNVVVLKIILLSIFSWEVINSLQMFLCTTNPLLQIPYSIFLLIFLIRETHNPSIKALRTMSHNAELNGSSPNTNIRIICYEATQLLSNLFFQIQLFFSEWHNDIHQLPLILGLLILLY